MKLNEAVYHTCEVVSVTPLGPIENCDTIRIEVQLPDGSAARFFEKAIIHYRLLVFLITKLSSHPQDNMGLSSYELTMSQRAVSIDLFHLQHTSGHSLVG
ncbi:hypothetical protein F5Y09DRAFT_307343 [Xylaria sp. FL1042]|nr:hypothetical protein F5Y09DRAFT_307343 [Xylaria sp. FL1042]